MIVIQTSLQKHMLKKLGHKGLCTDPTHGTTGYDFKLVSYIVIDDLDEGFPIAWCISNRQDFTTLKVFNQVLKDYNKGLKIFFVIIITVTPSFRHSSSSHSK